MFAGSSKNLRRQRTGIIPAGTSGERQTVRNLSRFSSNRGNVYSEERTRSETDAPRNLYTAWKSRVLPAGDDRQEEANKRAGVPGKSHHGQSHTMMIYPLVSCGRSLKIVPWVKRCNRLPFLKSGANLSALSSERRHRRCRLFQEDPLIFGINPINS